MKAAWCADVAFPAGVSAAHQKVVLKNSMEAARKAIFVLDDVLDMSFVPPASWGAVRSRWQYRYKGLPVESLTTRMTRPSIGRPWPSMATTRRRVAP